LFCSQVVEHSAGCSGSGHEYAQFHFVCRAFDGRNFQPLAEGSKAEKEVFLMSQLGRKIRRSAAVKGVIRKNGYHGVESPVTTVHEQNSSQTQGKLIS